MSLLCHSEAVETTQAIGALLAAELVPDGVLLLSGDLGSGKTVLTQGLALGLGIHEHEVQSPSYTLVREHRGLRGDLIHVDLYRLDDSEVQQIGLLEILSGPGVKVVEWAERLPFEVPGAIRMSIRVSEPPEGRRIELTGVGENLRLIRGLEQFSVAKA